LVENVMSAQSHGARGYQETLLVDTLDRMRRNPEGRKVVHLHLSQLMPAHRTPVRVKIVTRMFRALESGRQAQLFNLSNDDLVLIINAGAQRDVNNIVLRVRKLFEGDPITFDDDMGRDRFATWYDLGLDAANAIQAAQQLRQEAQQGSGRASGPQLPPVSPAILDDVQKKLAFANVVPFIRDQVALRVNPATKEASIEFYEFFLSVGDLQRAVAPNVNLLGDRWLFQDLSRTMDLRMLETVVRAPHARGAPSISLNLNLETIMTQAFATFLEQIERGQKVIVEIQTVDVLTNIGMYLDARNVLNSMNHAMLIDGLTTTTLEMLDVASMKPDYAKIVWSPELLDTMHPAGSTNASAMVNEIGAEKVVLSRCDSAAALAWGLKSGITVFQGHFLDSFNKARRRAASAPARRPA
jgi:EAL domain-containing protein (putative c-di-GMP-specific phosphodiesterase class I)